MRKRKKASILILFSLLVSSAAYKGKIFTLAKNNLLALMRPFKNGKKRKFHFAKEKKTHMRSFKKCTQKS